MTTRGGEKDRLFWAIAQRFAKRAPDPESAESATAARWRLLALLNLYRMIVAAAFVAIAILPDVSQALNLRAPHITSVTACAYFLFALMVAVAVAYRWPNQRLQSHLEPLVDLVASAIIAQAVGVDLGILAVLVIPAVMVAAAVADSWRGAAFFAALAALTVLGAAVGNQVGSELPPTGLTEAGLFGLAILALALLANALARELLRSQMLAARRGQELQRLNEINRHIVAQLRTGVVVVNEAGQPERANPAARRLLGSVELEEVARLARDFPVHRVQALQLADRSTLAVTVVPVGAAEDAARLIFLEVAGAAAEQAQALKLAALGRLTAAVAHQIRNPLGAIAHASQLLEEGQSLGPREARLVQIVRRQSTRLDSLINDILDLSRPGPATARRIRLAGWFRDFLVSHRERHPDRVPRLAVKPPPPGLEVRFDPGHLEHIVTNLVDNAFVHADSESGVELVCDDYGGRATIEVRDRGPGLPADIEPLFEPFTTTHASGTGLGLYIARELAAANGARLVAFNRPAGGACFRLELAHDAAWLE